MEGTRKRAAAYGVTLALVVGGALSVSVDAVSAAPQRTSLEARTAQVLPAGVPARKIRSRTTSRWGGSVNTYNWQAVNAAYWRDYAPGLSLPTGWTGDDSSCRAGSTSAKSQAATARAINFVRSLSGLYPISLNATLNARSQYTALLMSANRTLSHHPGSRWKCYTSTGAANAARSNLVLAYPSITSSGVVGLYMQEPGASNYAVGHRRWLLNPFTTQMGTGATNTANAVTVIGPTSPYRPNPTWVSWPTAGWFPNTLEPSGRWSLSTGDRGLSFGRATVRVWRNGAPIRAVKNRVVNGYGMPTIVFQLPTSVSRSGTFTIKVSGIRRAHKRKKIARLYTVSMFAPRH